MEIWGAIAKPFVNLWRGASNLYKGVFRGGGFRQAVGGLVEMTVGVAFPGYGAKGGAFWPGTPGDTAITQSPNTSPSYASSEHDLGMGTPSDRGGWANSAPPGYRSSHHTFRFIKDSFTGPGREPGPYGQAYRAAGVVGFGAYGSLLWLAGQ